MTEIMNQYNYFCTGCGLCKAILPDDVTLTNDKFCSYFPKNAKACDLCEKICLSSDDSMDYSSKEIFGFYRKVFFTYSKNFSIRKKASSGGTLTTIALYLLENHLVDGIIQVEKNGAYSLKMAVHTKVEEILSSAGSKYIDSNNLETIFKLIENGKKYCFVGKPCEVSTLRRYSKIDPRISRSIIYYLSFFCAGAPSVAANHKLVGSLGCSVEECADIVYRGNGWPGKTIIKDKNGNEYETKYENSWMNYLGRDTRTICKFCIDGIGEMADISCGDAWYLKDGKPDFHEQEGRNITFVRTDMGEALFNSMLLSNCFFYEPVTDVINYLKLANPHQFTRRASLNSTINALKLAGRPYPHYNKKVLQGNSKYLPLKTRIRRMIGTVLRIIKGRI